MKPDSTPTACTCPLCCAPLAGTPSTTIVDYEPWFKQNQPPVQVAVHRACADRVYAALPDREIQTLAAPVVGGIR